MSLRDEVLNTKIYSRHLETYADYKKNVLPKIADLDKQWVFDIIDGKKEKDQVLYQDDDFVLLPSDKWKNNNILEMRLLAFFTNKKLKSIRDLTGSNIKLLEKVKNKAQTRMFKNMIEKVNFNILFLPVKLLKIAIIKRIIATAKNPPRIFGWSNPA